MSDETPHPQDAAFPCRNRVLSLFVHAALQHFGGPIGGSVTSASTRAARMRIEMDLHSPSGRSLRDMHELEHELRTPLASILSISEILRDHPELGEDERRRFLDAMHEESWRLAELVDFLLRSGRLDRTLSN
jgi:signal transduction histidine kinase